MPSHNPLRKIVLYSIMREARKDNEKTRLVRDELYVEGQIVII